MWLKRRLAVRPVGERMLPWGYSHAEISEAQDRSEPIKIKSSLESGDVGGHPLIPRPAVRARDIEDITTRTP